MDKVLEEGVGSPTRFLFTVLHLKLNPGQGRHEFIIKSKLKVNKSKEPPPRKQEEISEEGYPAHNERSPQPYLTRTKDTTSAERDICRGRLIVIPFIPISGVSNPSILTSGLVSTHNQMLTP